MIFYEDGIKLGEISEWKLTERFAEKKVLLGKEIMGQKPKDLCQFVSPKIVKRKRSHWIIDGTTKLNITVERIVGGTEITGVVESRETLASKDGSKVVKKGKT